MAQPAKETPRRGKVTFQPIGQDRRRARSTNPGGSPIVEALMKGETLLISNPDGKPYSTGWTNRVLKDKGMKAVTRQDPDGTVVWAVPLTVKQSEEHLYDPTKVDEAAASVGETTVAQSE